ncbi:hypothetical protein JOC77_000861 [Peribacillus deserti]|uniref:DUF4181 domain-containing protein n=1 Tax=Peribacillus deserti TaxID=673318 RepID=A0ABS2QE76_9BACI|nr:hypothetical protein [Peribacillus deserti]MBM7691456.1 hypothetical protein [Peribacillus deserti]
MKSLKHFFKWYFKRGAHNVSGLISFILMFGTLQLVDYSVIKANPLRLILLFLLLLALYQVSDTFLAKKLKEKNKDIGFRYFLLTIFIMTGLSTILN